MSLRERFAANLKSARARAGISQEALAGAANLDRTYISALERNLYSASLDAVESIAKALKVDAVELLQLPGKKRAK